MSTVQITYPYVFKYFAGFLLLFISMLLFYTQASAQVDTLKSKNDSLLIEMKTAQLTYDSIAKVNAEKSKEFYKKSQSLFNKNKALKKVAGVFIRNNNDEKDSLGFKIHITDTTKNILALTNLYTQPENIEETYKILNGKITGNIYFRRLDPFGYDIDDTIFPPQNAATRQLNKLHIETKDWVLKLALNMKTGEAINSSKLAFEENYIRDLSYIKDCRILPVFREYCINDSVCYSTDTIDFIIVTQDAWSIIPSITINRVPDESNVIDGYIEKALYGSKYRISLNEYNLAGMGHQLSGTYYHNGKQVPPDAYRGAYSIPVFTKAQATLNVQYDNFPEQSSCYINFNRNFVSPVTKYGYGLTTGISSVYGDVLKDTLRQYSSPVKFSINDAWLGRSFKLWFLPARMSSKTRGIVSMRYYTLANIKPISDFNDSTRQFQNNFALLGNIGVTSRSYFRDVLIYGFGNTENIPSGISAAFTAGYNKVSTSNLMLMRLTFAGGKYINGTGYYYLSSSIDGLAGNGGVTDMSFQLAVNHFSRLYTISNCRFRQFYAAQYIYIDNNVYMRHTDLSRSNGIRGKGTELWYGTHKLRFNFESVLFTPVEVIGFNFNIYAFLDCGIINNRYASLFKNSLYNGLGLGMRLKNDHFVMNVIQVQFGYYPNVPYDVSSTAFSAGSVNQYKLNDFTINKPLLFDY